jgi:hypothetical protein
MNATNTETVQALVERFASQLNSYKQSQYNETQTRREFIEPFFVALGWDVANEQGYAEAYKNVVHEEALKICRATKAPDYSFRVGGVRKFLLEAKKPSINLKNHAEAAFQVRRYGWSAKLPLSILSNFAEFAVYDCRIKPAKTDNAASVRLLYLTYTDYLERWNELVGIFSREAILKGAFDKYLDSKPTSSAEVDTAFLAEIERWRDILARNIALRNPALTQRQLNFAVQQTIDKIIFLRICEDRGIEDYGRLLALLNGPQIYTRLFQRFKQADERYNSGLFHFQTEKQRENPDTLTPTLVIDDKVLKDILKNLYYPDSPYEFSVLPADILGQVYEQFLGKVIRLTPAHRAVVEKKPEVKKAGGVYYTPSYIVDYIVKQTVGQLFAHKKPNEVRHLKILDPACGSGAFLLQAYQFLLDWYTEHYSQNPKAAQKRKPPRLYQTMGGVWQLTIEERKRILLTHLFGVDIDPQAVEVTKLSLLLKVLENEQKLFPQLSMFRERVLPDLDKSIKCGNSLISNDFYQGQQLGLLDEDTIYRINAFDWETEFAEILPAGGFDAVIGNPPYGAFLSPDETEYLLNHFALQDYRLDTYLLFLEKSFALIKEKGRIGLIIPNTWLLNLKSEKIRKYIFNHTTIQQVVHYRHRVFNKATVDTEIVIIQKQLPIETHQIDISLKEKEGRSINYVIAQKRGQMSDGKPVNIFERPEFTQIADKLRACQKLESLCAITQGAKPFQVGKGKPPQTREIVNKKPYVSEIPHNKTFRPLLRGRLIQRYEILWNNNYWISFGDWLAEPRYSANYDAPGKIVIRQTGYRLIATLDRNQFIVRDNLYTIVSRQNDFELRFLLGLINSRLLQWFYSKIINPEVGEALAQVKRGHLAQLPIVEVDLYNPIDKANYNKMVQLVEKMLNLHKQLATANVPQTKTVLTRQIEATDKQIDQLVYQLYCLTVEEIVIVEKS